MAGVPVKPVKVLTDLVTKKQILKKDTYNRTLFSVSGSSDELGNNITGLISSSLPISASSVYTPQLKISASAPFSFTDLEATRDPVLGHYNVDTAIHAIDVVINKTRIADIVRAKEAENAYKRLRFQNVGSFDVDGYAEVKLPLTMSNYDYPNLSPGGTLPVFENGEEIFDAGAGTDPNYESFPTSSKNYINLDVMVKDMDDVNATWTNDIIAVNLVVSGTANDELWVRMYAPDLASADGAVKYRLLAVNEDPSKYVIL